MTTPVKVLWLTKGLGRGGAETLLTTSAPHLDSLRFDVEVAYLLTLRAELAPALRARGMTVHDLGQTRTWDLRWALRLRRLVQERGFQVVHTHMPLPASVARIVLPSSVAVVHTEHNVWQSYHALTRMVNAGTFRRNDAVIAVSKAVRRSMTTSLLPRPPATTEVLLHGIEPDSVRAGPEARLRARTLLRLPADAFVIGTVASLTPKKDQASLLAAFALLKAQQPQVRLVLIGDGPLRRTLGQQVQQLGLAQSVQFTGARDDVSELLPALDLFALSSLHEGLSIALIEALSAGVPAVCTDVGGVSEALRDGVDGTLVPARNPDRLAEAMLRFVVDPVLRDACGREARTAALRFDIGKALRRIEDVYDEVLSRT